MCYQMRRFSDIDWAKLLGRSEGPVDLCLRNDVPVYLKVRRDCQLVYRHYQAGQDLRHLPLMDFYNDVLFLRIDAGLLREISVSGYCHVKKFSCNGLYITDRSSIGPDGVADKIPLLAEAEFDYAFLVDRKGWENRNWLWRNPLVPPMGSRCVPEDFICELEVGKNDLWFATCDIEMLEKYARNGRELVSCPLRDQDRMPGIYWMFQAAYAYNDRKLMSKKEIKAWLTDAAPRGTYAYRSIRTAEKFVWLNVDRSRGAKGRGEFILDDLDALDDRDKYEFSFVSKGLSFILAIGNWWAEIIERSPNEGNQALADKLYENKFNGGEVEDLVYLISGSRMSAQP